MLSALNASKWRTVKTPTPTALIEWRVLPLDPATAAEKGALLKGLSLLLPGKMTEDQQARAERDLASALLSHRTKELELHTELEQLMQPLLRLSALQEKGALDEDQAAQLERLRASEGEILVAIRRLQGEAAAIVRELGREQRQITPQEQAEAVRIQYRVLCSQVRQARELRPDGTWSEWEHVTLTADPDAHDPAQNVIYLGTLLIDTDELFLACWMQALEAGKRLGSFRRRQRRGGPAAASAAPGGEPVRAAAQ